VRLYSHKWLKLLSPTIAAMAASLPVSESARYGWAPASHETSDATVDSATSSASDILRSSTSSADLSMTAPAPSSSLDWYRWLEHEAATLGVAAKLTYMRLLATMPHLEPPSSVVTDSGSVLAVWRDKSFHAEVEFYPERVAWLLVSKLGSRRVVANSDEGGNDKVSADFIRLFSELWHARRASS